MRQQIKKLSVVRHSQTQLEITFELLTDMNVSLYWTQQADSHTTDKTCVTHHAQSPIIIDDPLKATSRIYFILEADQQKPYLFGERTLPIEGLNNFRDFGGYLAANGRHVKWGQFYRSNHLHALSESAKSYISALNIKTIIDYRCNNEIRNHPNDNIGEIQTLHLDASAQTAELAAQFAADPSHEDKALIESVMNHIPKRLINGRGEQVLEQYRNFVLSAHSKQSFRRMLQALLDSANSPSLQHCRGGKDRTGYGVLLVQLMLGVSEHDIIYDYMLTHDNRLARNQIKMAAYRKITDDEDILGYLLSLIDTRECFVQEILTTMKQVAGSPSNYIKQELGFTDYDFALMQHHYLE